MKKFISIFLIVIFSVLLTEAVVAQIGLRGGVNLTKFVGSDVEAAEDVMGLNAGLSFTILRLGPISLVPEVYYAEKGARFTDQIRSLQSMNPDQPGIDDSFDLEFNLAYVEVPLLVKLSLPFISTNYVFPYISGGPVYGWRLDCSFSMTSNLEKSVNDCADNNFSDLQTTFKEADRGYILGSGIDFVIPYLGMLTLDARYARGLTRLREGSGNDDIQNQSFTLMLGYGLGF